MVAALAPTLGALSAGIGFFASQVLQTTGCIAAIVWRAKEWIGGNNARVTNIGRRTVVDLPGTAHPTGLGTAARLRRDIRFISLECS